MIRKREAGEGRREIPVIRIGGCSVDLMRVEFPEGSFLSLGQVVKLHKTNPTLFAWCD